VPVILGPTGIGKSRAAFEVARALGGEVVVADSRQVYRELDIATNKPSPGERAAVRYHCIDLVEPGRPFSVYDFVQAATAAIEDAAGRGRLPIVEGGSVLYVDALTDGFSLAGVAPRQGRRQELERLSTEELAAQLDALEPGLVVDRRNRVRLVRAIELLEVAGPPLARLRQRTPPPWEAIRIGLSAPLEVTDRRLEERSRRQVERGLVAETRRALEAGLPPGSQVMSGIGYQEALAFIRGELSEQELPLRMAQHNRRYARYQLRWLRKDPRVHWVDAEPDPVPGILEHLAERLR
jgi:tRNA dimethylallyltransferase